MEHRAQRVTEKNNNKSRVLALLSEILASEEFRNSPQLQRFLEYVVKREIENNGAGIKAYSIGVDALGKSEDFDPQSDNSVRVAAGRLRKSLSNYYHHAEKAWPVTITLPTGSYRPEFVLSNGEIADLDAYTTTADAPHLGARWKVPAVFAAIAIAFAVVASISLLVFSNQSAPASDTFRADMPILEIGLIEPTGDTDLDVRLDGLRHRIAEDLSRFRIARIRLSGHETRARSSQKPGANPRFQITGVVVGRDPNTLQFSVADLADNTLLWSETIELPDSWSSYDELITEGVSRVILKIVGSRGTIPITLQKELTDFAKRRETSNSSSGSGFDCVLIFHAFDASKTESLRTEARACLGELINANNQDSEVWGAWAMINFLDWTRSQDDTLLDVALQAARKAVSLDTNYANAHEYLGSIQMAKGNRDLARDSYQTALGLNPYKPDLHVLVGWEEALGGAWDSGVDQIERGISIDPSPAAWMRIPLAMDGFRRGDFAASLYQSELMIEAGDERGVVLALAAAVAMEDYEQASELSEIFLNQTSSSRSDPMKEIRGVFDDQDLLEQYDELLANWFIEPA